MGTLACLLHSSTCHPSPCIKHTRMYTQCFTRFIPDKHVRETGSNTVCVICGLCPVFAARSVYRHSREVAIRSNTAELKPLALAAKKTPPGTGGSGTSTPQELACHEISVSVTEQESSHRPGWPKAMSHLRGPGTPLARPGASALNVKGSQALCGVRSKRPSRGLGPLGVVLVSHIPQLYRCSVLHQA